MMRKKKKLRSKKLVSYINEKITRKEICSLKWKWKLITMIILKEYSPD